MRKISLLMVFVLLFGWSGSTWADLVGYWPLDGDATDLSGNGNEGAIYGDVTPAEDRFGDPSGAMSFAGGADDKISVGDAPEFNLTGAMTITAWVYLDSDNPVHNHRNARILAKMGSVRAWSSGIEKESGGVPFPATIQVASNGSTVVGLNDDAALPLDQWVHFAGVYTPGTSLEVYLNGDLAAIRTDGIPASQFSNNGQPVLIGHRPNAGDCGWYGSLDEVRLYNEALSQRQIKAIMGDIQATNPDPYDGEDRVQLDKVLSWDPPDPCELVDPPAEYIVYFDPNESLVASGDASVRFGQQSQNQFDPFGVGDMELVTTYYWRIDVVDPNFGAPVTYPGVVWKFTTIAPKAGLISPENGASGVAQNAVLKWDPGFGATGHKVYFGTDQTLVTNGDVSVYMGTQVETTFDPDLDWETEYFWRIDEVFGTGSPEPGDVWSFTTGTPICEYELEGDIDKNCVVNLEDFALMADSWLICNLANGDCP